MGNRGNQFNPYLGNRGNPRMDSPCNRYRGSPYLVSRGNLVWDSPLNPANPGNRSLTLSPDSHSQGNRGKPNR